VLQQAYHHLSALLRLLPREVGLDDDVIGGVVPQCCPGRSRLACGGIQRRRAQYSGELVHQLLRGVDVEPRWGSAVALEGSLRTQVEAAILFTGQLLPFGQCLVQLHEDFLPDLSDVELVVPLDLLERLSIPGKPCSPHGSKGRNGTALQGVRLLKAGFGKALLQNGLQLQKQLHVLGGVRELFFRQHLCTPVRSLLLLADFFLQVTQHNSSKAVL